MNEVMQNGKYFCWDSQNQTSSELFCQNAIKTEYPPDEDFFQEDKVSNLSFSFKSKTVPTASTGAATASLQTAFFKKSKTSCSNPQSEREDIPKTEMNSGEGGVAGFCQMQFESERANVAHHTPLAGSVCQSGNNCEAQQMDIYRDLILRHLIQDISTTCAKLGLPTDPYNWTVEHGSRWISEMCVQFDLSLPPRRLITGRELLAMSQKEFEVLAPEGGDTLYAQLQLWKTAFESYNPQPCSENGRSMTASDNTVPRNWNPPQQNLLSPKTTSDVTDFNSQFVNSAPESQNMGYCTNASFTPSSSDNPSFFADVLLSPSNSDISSSGSVQDVNEDDCMDIRLNMMQMQQPNHISPFGQAIINQMGMTPPPSTDRHSPFARQTGTVHLWHFIRELLDHPKQYGSCVRWVDRDEGTFKIESSHHLARFWGQRKNRAQMNYDKLSRSLRQYYKKGIIQKPEKKQRLVYKFLPPYNL